MITAHGVSHTGRVRSTNEDTLLIDDDLGLYVVADGMGGHNAGDVASKLAVATLRAFMVRSRDGNECTWPFGVDGSVSLDANRLLTAVKLANRRVFKAADSNDDYTGMGTTVVATLVQGERLMHCGVGDSRVYASVDGALSQLTVDDSWAATMLATDPDMDEATLATHPMRHVLTNVLGATEETEVDVTERRLRDGDQVLLCSDGLHGALTTETIAAVLEAEPDVSLAAERLVREVLDGEAIDNVSALVLRYTE